MYAWRNYSGSFDRIWNLTFVNEAITSKLPAWLGILQAAIIAYVTTAKNLTMDTKVI